MMNKQLSLLLGNGNQTNREINEQNNQKKTDPLESK